MDAFTLEFIAIFYCVCVLHTYLAIGTGVEVRGLLAGILCFHLVGPEEDWTQIVSLGGKHLNLSQLVVQPLASLFFKHSGLILVWYISFTIFLLLSSSAMYILKCYCFSIQIKPVCVRTEAGVRNVCCRASSLSSEAVSPQVLVSQLAGIGDNSQVLLFLFPC